MSDHEEAQFVAAVSALLVDDKVIGWMDGRAEWGPRALGARSILARTDTPGQQQRLNRQIKNREDFRPFAPIVLADHADELFTGFSPGRALERTMQGVVTTRPEWASRLAAVTHVDGTARVQVLEPGDAPLLEKVLRSFYSITGLPVLINTSFNHASEPIVNSLADGLASMEQCSLDALAVSGTLYHRQASPHQPSAATALSS